MLSYQSGSLIETDVSQELASRNTGHFLQLTMQLSMIDDSAPEHELKQASAEFIILGDGKIIWRSGIMHAGEKAKQIVFSRTVDTPTLRGKLIKGTVVTGLCIRKVFLLYLTHHIVGIRKYQIRITPRTAAYLYLLFFTAKTVGIDNITDNSCPTATRLATRIHISSLCRIITCFRITCRLLPVHEKGKRQQTEY